MGIDIDKPAHESAKTLTFGQPKKKNKRAAKKPAISSDEKPNTSDGIAGIPNPSMEETVTEFAKSNYNPNFELFEELVDNIRKSVRKTVDYRKSVNDDSPDIIAKYTDEAIKKELRKSKWA